MTHRTLRHPVPDELLSRIGDVTVSFALLESMIGMVLDFLLGAHGRGGKIVLSMLPFRRLVEATVGIYVERFGKDSDFPTLQKLMREVTTIEEERNRITHSFWVAGSSTDSATRVKERADKSVGLDIKFQVVKPADLDEFVQRIGALTERVQRFHIMLAERRAY